MGSNGPDRPLCSSQVRTSLVTEEHLGVQLSSHGLASLERTLSREAQGILPGVKTEDDRGRSPVV